MDGVTYDGDSAKEGPIPWKHISHYAERRSVARFDDKRVKRFSARFKEPENSQGGLTPDVSAVLQDQRAVDVERVSGTVHHAEGGFRRHISVQEVASTAVEHRTDLVCSQGVCTEQLRTVSTPVNLTLMSQTRESNDREEFDHRVGADVRQYAQMMPDGTVVPVEIEVHNEDIDPSTLDERMGEPSPYGEMAQRDTDRNAIHIELELEPIHRKDYRFNMGGGLGVVETPGMGYSVKTYDLYAGGLRNPTLNDGETKSGASVDWLDDEQHYGFRQPSLEGAHPRHRLGGERCEGGQRYGGR